MGIEVTWSDRESTPVAPRTIQGTHRNVTEGILGHTDVLEIVQKAVRALRYKAVGGSRECRMYRAFYFLSLSIFVTCILGWKERKTLPVWVK